MRLLCSGILTSITLRCFLILGLHILFSSPLHNFRFSLFWRSDRCLSGLFWCFWYLCRFHRRFRLNVSRRPHHPITTTIQPQCSLCSLPTSLFLLLLRSRMKPWPTSPDGTVIDVLLHFVQNIDRHHPRA